MKSVMVVLEADTKEAKPQPKVTFQGLWSRSDIDKTYHLMLRHVLTHNKALKEAIKK